MTRLDALRQLVSTPRQTLSDARIGYVQTYPKADGREKISMVFKVLRLTKRKAS